MVGPMTTEPETRMYATSVLLTSAALLGMLANTARAEPAPARRSPLSPPTAPMLDVRRLMTQAEFRRAGLVKLDEAELVALNAWFEKRTLELLKEKQVRAGCNPPIESHLDGEFQGWDGDTVFKLRNGQIWKQASYSYIYHYSFSPGILIYQSGGACKLKVDGVDEGVAIERLK